MGNSSVTRGAGADGHQSGWTLAPEEQSGQEESGAPEPLGGEWGRQSRVSGPWCPGGRASVWSMCDQGGQDVQ